MAINNTIFSSDKFIGYVSKVSLDNCLVQIPSSVLINPFWENGEEYVAGIVGSYVLIEGLNNGFLGKIREVSIPEDEIKKLNEKEVGTDAQKKTINKTHPYVIIDFLLNFDLFETEVKKGMPTFPVVASKVYLCGKEILERLLQNKTIKNAFDFAILQNSQDVNIKINQSSLFSRHCAIIGNTGSGKSWTVAKTIEEVISLDDTKKVILIDATGEYNKFSTNLAVKSIYFGETRQCPSNYTAVNYKYTKLTVADLMLMLRPSPQSQTPKLLGAIKSLKIAKEVLEGRYSYRILNGTDPLSIYSLFDNNYLTKRNKDRSYFEYASVDLLNIIDEDNNDYDIKYLRDQIKAECVWENNRSNPNAFGDTNEQDLGYQSTLLTRISSLLDNPTLNNIFEFRPIIPAQGVTPGQDFVDTLNTFLSSDYKMLLIDFSKVGFEHHAREVLVNIIGKELLKRARQGNFKSKPIITFIDEAHQFLNKNIQDSYAGEIELDAFDMIAKECRKHGLYLCLSTQMPRDIPIGTLSQMGTFIIHRLINDKDVEMVRGACSGASKNLLSGLANLSSGEAIISSVNLPFPITIKIKKPNIEPESESPIEKLDS